MTAWLEFVLFQTFKAVFIALPRSWCLSFGRALGSLAFRLDGHHRRIALSNLSRAFGQNLGPTELHDIALASFRRFGQVMADIFKLFHLDRQRREALVSVEGEENLTNALAQGKGALVFSAHLGNWELGSLMISKAARLHVVARALDNRILDKALAGFRRSLGADVIYKQDAARKVLGAIRDREIVAILIDQNVLRSQAVFVDFFGYPAATTPALGAFYLRTRAPLVPVFCLPETSSGGYRLKILPSPEIELGPNRDADVLKITRICTKIIETEILKSPEDWLWFHDRWRSRPKEDNDRQNQIG